MNKPIRLKANLHNLNSDEEMAKLIPSGARTNAPVKPDRRSEITTLLHQFETKLSEFRRNENDPAFLNRIDERLQSIQEVLTNREELQRSDSSPTGRTGLGWR